MKISDIVSEKPNSYLLKSFMIIIVSGINYKIMKKDFTRCTSKLSPCLLLLIIVAFITMKATTGSCQAVVYSPQTGGSNTHSKHPGTTYPLIYPNFMVPNTGNLYLSEALLAYLTTCFLLL